MQVENDIYDVIIIGGGACGLMAAAEISKSPFRAAVLEAKDRLGGRMYTVGEPAFTATVELGAEFIHGKLPLTLEILKEKNIPAVTAQGEMWGYFNKILQKEDLFDNADEIKKIYTSLKHDIPVAEFARRYLTGTEHHEAAESILNYVEGYHAADPEKASSLKLLKDYFSGEEEDLRIKDGYQQLASILYEKARKNGVHFFLSLPVKEINYESEIILVHSSTTTFKTKKLIITISLGCLQNETIRFTPALPSIISAAGKMGFGSVIKILAEFNEPFWKTVHGKDLSKMLFVFSNEKIPTWWTQFPAKNNVITGWLAGPEANLNKNLSEETFREMSIQSLSAIFNRKEELLKKELKAFRVANWALDPYTLGAYSYEVVNGDLHKRILMTPVEGIIFFAGEALQVGSETGTVEAALHSGKQVVDKILLETKQ